MKKIKYPKMSEATKGENNPMYGKHHIEESINDCVEKIIENGLKPE
jgi:hypothetical protein